MRKDGSEGRDPIVVQPIGLDFLDSIFQVTRNVTRTSLPYKWDAGSKAGGLSIFFISL